MRVRRGGVWSMLYTDDVGIVSRSVEGLDEASYSKQASQ